MGLNIFPSRQVIKELRTQVSEMQHSLNILIGGATESTSSRGNPYKDYASAIEAIVSKYEGTAEWGILQMRNIIDLRSAFIIGQGIKLVTQKKDEREKEFIEEFIRHNDLDEELPQELAKEAEQEGRVLVKLAWNSEKNQVDMRYISYSINKYTVITPDDDYKRYDRVEWTDAKKGAQKLEAEAFVYKKFAGRLSKVNDIMPKVAMVLRACEALDKALADWRDINHLFAAPTPFFKCTSNEEVKTLTTHLKTINWKIGKMIAATAEYSLKGPESEAGLTSLENEIVTNAKFISGATGIPVHFLGLPDLMSNRAVSTDLFEFINASTNKERHVWEGFYEELFNKAIVIANANKKGLKEGKVKANVMQITEAKIKELVDVWMPLYVARIVDLDYVLSKIPDADPDLIKKSLSADMLKALEDIKKAEKNNDDEVPE